MLWSQQPIVIKKKAHNLMKNDFLPDSVCFHYLVRVEKNCWRFHTCGKLYVCLDFVSCCKSTKWSQLGGCNHNHHQKLWPVSMLLGGNFYHSYLFLVHIRLSWLPESLMIWWCDLNFQGERAALRFTKIDCIIIKKKMRWPKLACWHFCYLAGKWLPKLFIIPVSHMGYHHYWLTI